ncbi:preATP grasp domain-containing protein [Micromonospora aurantiaca (nom. illeg.)]|uniref:preATP grasp domain-containing protein n=1 Tax=Micromonospora aurantiaca (nom. illeg.) TaxID=47850 RepID=UPI00369B1F92
MIDISLLLLNIRVDLPKDLALGAEPGVTFPMAKSTARALWHMKENCIVVCPFRVKPEYVDHVTTILGIDPASVRLVFTDSLLWDELLTGDELWEAIESARGDLGGTIVEVNACFQTRGVIELRRRILGDSESNSDAFLAEGGADFFNRKSLFRRLAAGLRIPLPEGRTVRGSAALRRAVLDLLPITGTVIVKRDNAWSGLGNFAITTDLERPIQGVSRGYPAGNVSESFMDSLYSEMCLLESEVIVVEAYHDFTSAFFFEYLVESDGSVRFLQSFEMKHRPAGDPNEPWRTDWIGLEMPANLPPAVSQHVQDISERTFRFAADLGYRGHIHLDAILLKDGRILFNETNARWSGGTVLHNISSRLLGPHYRDSFMSSYRLLPAVSGSALYTRFESSPLAFSSEAASGSVMVICDPEGASETEALVMGPTRQSIVEGEAPLAKYLSEAVAGP